MSSDDYFKKSLCEDEERIYVKQRFRKIRISPIVAFLMVFSCISLWGAQCFMGDKGKLEERHEWDGAGDTWTCKKCGTKNYNWQISCGGCRG